jgi:hypothetical protein
MKKNIYKIFLKLIIIIIIIIMNLNFILFLTLLKTCSSYLLSINGKSDPKLCINCKHYIESDFNKKFGKCDKYSPIEKVSGDKLYVYACMARNSPFLCGKNADGYEEKNKFNTINDKSNFFIPPDEV